MPESGESVPPPPSRTPQRQARPRHWRLARRQRRAERACPRSRKGRVRTTKNAWCVFGRSCRFGLECWGKHLPEHHAHFQARDKLRTHERLDGCAYCAQGVCSFGGNCRGVTALHPAGLEPQLHPPPPVPTSPPSISERGPRTPRPIEDDSEGHPQALPQMFYDCTSTPRRRYHRRRRRGRGARRRQRQRPSQDRTPRQQVTHQRHLDQVWATSTETQTGTGLFASFTDWYVDQLTAALKAMDLRIELLLDLDKGFKEEPLALITVADRYWSVVGSTEQGNPLMWTDVVRAVPISHSAATQTSSNPTAQPFDTACSATLAQLSNVYTQTPPPYYYFPHLPTYRDFPHSWHPSSLPILTLIWRECIHRERRRSTEDLFWDWMENAGLCCSTSDTDTDA